jgi:Fic family protein
MLHFRLTNEQTIKLQQLMLSYKEAKDRLEVFSKGKLDYIFNQSIISNIGASTRIENAVLTDIEIEWLDTVVKAEAHAEYLNQEQYIKNKLSKDKERSIEEVAGYRNAINIVLNSFYDFYPLKIADIKGLHREMLKYYRQANYHLGDYKKLPNTVVEKDNITLQEKIVLKTADPGIITLTSMDNLVTWYNQEINENPWALAVAVEFVLRFLAIHPFQDGNGRLSRLLFHIALFSSKDTCFKEVIPYIAMDRLIEQTRSKYYLVLRKCSGGVFNTNPKAYKYEYFLNYMIDILDKSLDNLTYYSNKYDSYNGLSETAHDILQCFKSEPEKFLQTKDIIRITGISRRTIIYTLNTLKVKQFIQQSGKGAGSRYKLVF